MLQAIPIFSPRQAHNRYILGTDILSFLSWCLKSQIIPKSKIFKTVLWKQSLPTGRQENSISKYMWAHTLLNLSYPKTVFTKSVLRNGSECTQRWHIAWPFLLHTAMLCRSVVPTGSCLTTDGKAQQIQRSYNSGLRPFHVNKLSCSWKEQYFINTLSSIWNVRAIHIVSPSFYIHWQH